MDREELRAMYGFRNLTDNRVFIGAGLAVLVIVLGVGTYMLMYQPSGGMSIHIGSAPKSPEGGGPVDKSLTPSASPATVRSEDPVGTSLEVAPVTSPALPPRSAISMKIQSSGGSTQQVDDLLKRAQQFGYQAMPADVQGKAITGVVIRHKPGLSAVALRASTDLAPSAILEEHADISVDVVIAVGKS